MDPQRFADLTLSRSFAKVWAGIHEALAVGLKVKINVVLMKGITDAEIDDFARLAFTSPVEIRFIEFMPLCGDNWRPELVVPVSHVRTHIAARYRLMPLPRGSEVAESYQMI